MAEPELKIMICIDDLIVGMYAVPWDRPIPRIAFSEARDLSFEEFKRRHVESLGEAWFPSTVGMTASTERLARAIRALEDIREARGTTAKLRSLAAQALRELGMIE